MQVHAGGLEVFDALWCGKYAGDINRAFGSAINEDLASVRK